MQSITINTVMAQNGFSCTDHSLTPWPWTSNQGLIT